MTDVTIGTFNLNNLFSRFNFKGTIKNIQLENVKYEFKDGSTFKIRTFIGKLVKAKENEETDLIAERIKNMNVDVLAVQEVEDIDTLKVFNRDNLGGMYDHQVLVEGNDPRFIDVGFLSKLPLRAITSWQKSVHPDDLSHPVFGRDLLEVEVMDEDRADVLFVVYNNHLKSQFVPYWVDDKEGETQSSNERRKRQSEMIKRIVESESSGDGRYVIVGDMNDSLDSPYLAPFVNGLNLVNALEQPKEVKSLPPPESGYKPNLPDFATWTHRYKPTGEDPEYILFDQIWLSPALADHHDKDNAWIDRRVGSVDGDGSDHDPAYIKLTNL